VKVNRRSFLKGLVAIGIAPKAVMAAKDLEPVKPIEVPKSEPNPIIKAQGKPYSLASNMRTLRAGDPGSMDCKVYLADYDMTPFGVIAYTCEYMSDMYLDLAGKRIQSHTPDSARVTLEIYVSDELMYFLRKNDLEKYIDSFEAVPYDANRVYLTGPGKLVYDAGPTEIVANLKPELSDESQIDLS